MALAATSNTEKFTDNIWICDSGACGHYCISDKGIFNVKEISESIRAGNSDIMMATKVGTLKCQAIQIDGSGIDNSLHEFMHIPDLWVNLFSINQALKKGHKNSNDEVTISLSNGSSAITFDRILKEKYGIISGIKMSVYNRSQFTAFRHASVE